ncbi:MAG: hypothetical protein ACTSXT_09420 [Candidatus Helarchaeota archaeon]
MSKKLLTFLGTRKYIESCYSYNGNVSKPNHFIQMALIELICNNWDDGDQIIIFLTERAKNMNWLGKNASPGANFEIGLRERLEHLKKKYHLKWLIFLRGELKMNYGKFLKK